MNPVRVLGIGSPFAGDDLGWRLAEALERVGLLRSFSTGMVHINLCDRPGCLLLPAMRGAHLAILLDAMRSGAQPGTVRRLDMLELDESTGLLSSHGFGVAEALALGRVLGDLPPRVLIYGIETGQAPSLPPLGDLVAILWPAIIDDIRVCGVEPERPSHVSSVSVTPFSPANAHSIHGLSLSDKAVSSEHYPGK